MKCPYCGGEVSSQSVKCPYCGRDNKEGIAFQEEVRKRIEKNRLLRPFLIKQKTPELVQRMLTRILLIIAGVNVLLIVCSFGVYMWSGRESKTVPESGSHAEAYVQNFGFGEEYYAESFGESVRDYLACEESGKMPSGGDIEQMVQAAYHAMKSGEDETYIRAFFSGYLALDDKECAFLDAALEEDAPYSVDNNLKDIAVEAVLKRAEGGRP